MMRPILFAVLAFLFSMSCKCWRPEDPEYSSPRCVISRQSVDCTVRGLKQFAPAVLPVLSWIFSGAKGKFEGDQELLSQLMGFGMTDLMCIGEQVQNSLFKETEPGNYSAEVKLQTYGNTFNSWKKRNGLDKIKVKTQ